MAWEYRRYIWGMVERTVSELACFADPPTNDFGEHIKWTSSEKIADTENN